MKPVGSSSHRLKSLILFVITITAVLANGEGAAQATTEDIERAKAHFRVGVVKYHQGRYEDALKEFERSYRLSKRAALLFNIAQCYERLGDLKKAVAYRKQYLAALPDAPNRAEVQAQIQAIEARLAATAIRIVGRAPAGSAFMLDGKRATVDAKGLIRTSPGTHEVVVLHKGTTLFRGVVVLAQGQQLRLPIKTRRSRETAKPVSRSHRTRRMALWMVLGSAGAVLVTAAGLGAAALATANDANEALDNGYLTNYEHSKSKAKHLALGADISFAVAGGLAVTGLVLYLLDRRKHSEAAKHALLLPMVAPGTLGLSTSWSFRGF